MAGDEVEFLSPDDTDPDDLAAPEEAPDGSDAPRRRLHRAARVGVVAALVAGAAVWIATRPGTGGTSDTAAAPSSSATTASATSATPSPTMHVQDEHYGEQWLLACVAGNPAAPDLAAVVRRYFPAVRFDGSAALACVRGTTSPRRVVFESVGGAVHGVHLTIAVTARGPAGIGAPRVAPHPRLPVLGTVATESGSVLVSVTAYGPRGSSAPQLRMRALADRVSLYPPSLQEIESGLAEHWVVMSHWLVR